MNRIMRISTAICWVAIFDVLTPFALRAYLVGPPEGLDKMASNADIICKAQVVSFAVVTNAAFPPFPGFETRTSRLRVISVLKGNPPSDYLWFQHYTANLEERMSMYSPQHYELETGACYLIFAVKTDRENEYRQIRMSHTAKEDEGAMRTLDDRPLHSPTTLRSPTIKHAHWQELELLLHSPNSSNQLYAIHQLDALSQCGSFAWGHTKDFQREAVLNALSPAVTNNNAQVAIAALNCFQVGPNESAQITPFADTLVHIADNGSTVPRRTAAIAAFAGTAFPVVSNSLPQWLHDPSDEVRFQAVMLLPSFDGEFSERALRERASDSSPKVRAGVADAIGNGKIESLLPTLQQLLSDTVGLTNPVPPLTTEDLRAGGRVGGGNNHDVHTAAGYALLKFDVSQVGDLLKANLNDEGFRPNYVCKLAELETGPWLTNLGEVLESRRCRVEQEVETSGIEPRAFYLQSRMTLSGTYGKCWDLINNYLRDQPAAEYADGKMNRYLDALENAGDTGPREPIMLYELYRMKGLNQRAAKFRSEHVNQFAAYNINQFYDRVDAQYSNKVAISYP
jgi:hypothetical protein